MKHHYYKNGFTLAEVLITLGIIGVVAALTMPTLISNHQKKVLVTQLKKEYSTWNQAFQTLLADEGVDKLSDTTIWSKINNNSNSCSSSSVDCTNFFAAMQKYIKFEISSQREKNEYAGGRNDSLYFIKMQDGAIWRNWGFYKTPSVKSPSEIKAIKDLGGTEYSEINRDFIIDVNGYKKPNIMGRDIFAFSLSDNGRLYPQAGKDHALYYSQEPLVSNPYYWKNRSESCETETIGQLDKSKGCAARIMENGWVMDY